MAISADDYGLIRLGARVRDVSWVFDAAKEAFLELYDEQTSKNVLSLIEKHRMMFKNSADTGVYTQIQRSSPLGVVTEFSNFVRCIDSEPQWVGKERELPSYEVVYLIGRLAPSCLNNIVKIISERKDYSEIRTSIVLTDALYKNMDSLTVSTDELVRFYYRVRACLSSRSTGIRVFNRAFNIVSNKIVGTLTDIIGKRLIAEGKTNTVGAALVSEDTEERFKDCANFVRMMKDPYSNINEENVKTIEMYALPAIRQRFPFALPNAYDKDLYSPETNIQRAAKIAAEWMAGTRSLRINEVQTILNKVCEILTTNMPDQAKISSDVGVLASWSLLAGHPIDAFDLMMSYAKRNNIKLFVATQNEEVMNHVNDWCDTHKVNVSMENVCIELV